MSEFNNDLSDLEDEDSQEDDVHGLSNQKEAVIFLVDAGLDMFVKDQEDESPFESCLKCAKTVMQSKIISDERDLLAVVLYATEKSTNEEDFKHIYILQELEQPGAEKMLQLEKLLDTLESSNDPPFGHSSEYTLSDALSTCLKMLTKCSTTSKKVLLFSNNDNPHPDNDQQLKQCKGKVEELRQEGVEFSLMHINKLDHPFDVSLFYKDLLLEGEQEQLPEASERLDDLLIRVRMCSHKRRMLQQVALHFDQQLSIPVAVYNMCHPCKYALPVKTFHNNNQPITTTRKTVVKATGEEVEKGELRRGVKVNGRSIVFTEQEVNAIKCFKEPGLYLLGFKDKACLKPHHHLKPAQFVYPDEKSATGSACLFSALLSGCLERGVVVVCEYVARKNSPPRLVFLCPQAEELDHTRIQLTPPGFHLIHLPFMEDVRQVPVEAKAPRANKQEVEKAKELVKKLQFQFSCENFENPHLQLFYSRLEVMALDRDNLEDFSDFTQPDEEKIEKRAGRLMKELKEMVESRCEVVVPRKEVVKHSHLDIEEEAKMKRLHRLTVPVLRGALERLKVKMVGGRKAELIAAINKHFGI